MKTEHPLIQCSKYLLPQSAKIVLASMCSVLNKLCDIVPEILIGLAINIILNQENSVIAVYTGITDPFQQLYAVAFLTALLWIFESVFEYFYLILWRDFAHNVQHAVRCATYEHIQNLNMAYFEDKTTGGLLSVINNDVNELANFLTMVPNAVIQLAVNIIVMGAIFTYLSGTLALLTLLPIPFVVGVAYYFQNTLAQRYGNLRDRAESLSGHLASRLLGITTIKSYSTEHYELDCLRRESAAYKSACHEAGRTNAAYIPIVRMGVLCGFIMSMIVGGHYALTGIISISSYSVLVFLTQRFLWPFTEVSTITDTYEQAMASLRRICAVLNQTNSIHDGEKIIETNSLQGEIKLNNITFAYGNKTPLFKNLSLHIPAHSTVAFVGTTGSGKSTITKLLLRLYDITDGSIQLDGIDIKTLTLASLRKTIGLVSQDIYLLDGTIAENIAYGTFGASMDAIVDAATLAEAHNFIMQLPNGYQTLVGENGKNLSGGQRQRISIARAILKNPPILIFDEATSALDNETEAAVQRSLSKVAHKHTSIIIAHRLSTVRHADMIFVMEKGKTTESGTHEALLRKKGIYAALWNIQTGTTPEQTGA